MIKIYYESLTGDQYERHAYTIGEASHILENLFKARIKAVAYEGISLIGAVEIMNTKLTWWIR